MADLLLPPPRRLARSGYLVGGAVSSTHGWRAAFFVAGGPGLLAALLCLLMRRARAREAATRATAHRPARDRRARSRAMPLYRRTVLGYCAYTFALGGFALLGARIPAPRGTASAAGARERSSSASSTVAGGSIGTLARRMPRRPAVRARACGGTSRRAARSTAETGRRGRRAGTRPSCRSARRSAPARGDRHRRGHVDGLLRGRLSLRDRRSSS